MYRTIQKLLFLLCCLELSTGQYFQGAYGMDPQVYGLQNYGFYPGSSSGYESGFFSPSSYSGYAYSSPVQMRSAIDDSAVESTIKTAMTPLNNIVSSSPAQPLPPSLFTSLMQSSEQRSATSTGKSSPIKSNCTTGCSAPKSAEPAIKSGPLNQPFPSQSFQQSNHQQSASQGTQMCQCPCNQGWTYGMYPGYMPQNPNYASQPYPRSGSYYPVAHRPRQAYRVQQYRPYSYSKPSYYDPNYHTGYYSSIQN